MTESLPEEEGVVKEAVAAAEEAVEVTDEAADVAQEVDSVDSDDSGFGDFNEGDDSEFGEFEDTPEEEIPEKRPVRTGFEYKGDYEAQSDEIGKLVEAIVQRIGPESGAGGDNLEMSDRSKKLYQRLVDQAPNMQQIDWKRSAIRRQLLLILGLPINLDEVEPKQPEETPKNEEILDRIPAFETTGLSEEERKKVLQGTDGQIEQFYGELQPSSYYKLSGSKPEDLKDLEQIRDTLLTMVACWDKQVDDDRRDNELFASYVENLVGNTQKLSRLPK